MSNTGSTIVHSACAHMAFLCVQIPLTIILGVTHHKETALAVSLSVYALIWPCIGTMCGFILEIAAVGFAFATSISQLTRLVDKNVTSINLALSILSFIACFATFVLILPCTNALKNFSNTRAELPPPQAPYVLLSPPPRAVTMSPPPPLQWVTVISPDNHIGVAKQ